MYVILLLHEAVLVKAGSYDIKPKSSSDVFICRKSEARITLPSSIGISYRLPVRLSMIVSVLEAIVVFCPPCYCRATLPLPYGDKAAPRHRGHKSQVDTIYLTL